MQSDFVPYNLLEQPIEVRREQSQSDGMQDAAPDEDRDEGLSRQGRQGRQGSREAGHDEPSRPRADNVDVTRSAAESEEGDEWLRGDQDHSVH